MQPDILETEITRAARAAVAEVTAQIEARLATLDLSTLEGQYIASTCRFQQQVVSALLLWVAGEDERGTRFPVLMNAAQNGLANMISSLLLGRVRAEQHQEAAAMLMNDIFRDVFAMLQRANLPPDDEQVVRGATVLSGRA